MVMNELQTINLEQTDITTWNFDRLKKELGEALSVYKTTVYTDETIKLAKDDKAKLAKVKKIIEDQRKAYKAKCLAPYEALEPQIKEIVGMVEEQRTAIDDVVKGFTERQKAEKEKSVREYYEKKAFILGDLATPLFEKLLNPKWLNASASRKKVEEEVQIAINNVLNDINAIKAMESPFVDTLLEKYVATLSLDEAKAKHTELVEAATKAGINQQQAEINSPIAQPEEKQVVANDEEGITLKLYANQSQLEQVVDFMKAIGVNFEIQ
jgi:hypothetical protein